MRIPLLNSFAVSCAVCFQRVLKVTKVCLLLPFLLKKSSLNSTLALKTSKSFIQLGEHKDFTRTGHLSVCTNLCSFSGDPYPVWWWLFLVYETWCFSTWHHFIEFWMGFPHIILHDKFKTVHCYEVTNQNIPNFICYVYNLNFQKFWLKSLIQESSYIREAILTTRDAKIIPDSPPCWISGC